MELTVADIRTGRKQKRTAFVYIMDESRPLRIPTKYYMAICRQGYETFGFDQEKLTEALYISREATYER